MKKQLIHPEQGSILMIALLTITILTMICATSLYITSQNANATTQTTSWEQAMAGAEAAVDQAMNALNTNSWAGWYTVGSGSLPQTQPSPSGTPNAMGIPGSGNYNYYTSSFTLQGEASNTVTYWVTVDDGSVGPTPSPSPGLVNGGLQAYRVRAAGIVGVPGPPRVSNSRLDDDLRKVGLKFDRLAGGAIATPQAMRRIEVVVSPVLVTSNGVGLTMANGIGMSGSAYADTFNSGGQSNPVGYKGVLGVPNPNGQTLGYRDTSNPPVLNIVNNTWNHTDLRNTNVYGTLTYSGTTVPNIQNVKGGFKTPYPYGTPAPAPTPPPAGGGITYTTYSGGGSDPPASTFTAGNGGGTNYVKVNGDLTVSNSGKALTLAKHDNSGGQLVIWVTGDLTISGSGFVNQDTSTKVTWYVGGNIIFQGGYLNGNPGGSANSNPPVSPAGWAGNVLINGYGPASKEFKDQGSAVFTGIVYAPNYTMTISGSGVVAGALTGNTVDLSGTFHYDESLNPVGGSSSKFAFARWFEDNSSRRKDQNGNRISLY